MHCVTVQYFSVQSEKNREIITKLNGTGACVNRLGGEITDGAVSANNLIL